MTKSIKVHNKSDKPDNIVENENQIIEKCLKIEAQLPYFLKDFFIYLRNGVSIKTRLAYLQDILFFFNYLCEETRFSHLKRPIDMTEEDFSTIKARDINYFLGDYCPRYIVTTQKVKYIMENHNRSLSRKRSSLSVLFKYAFRDEMISENITQGFNPIKLPKTQPDSIKKLEIEEVETMLNAVTYGTGLTDKERQYWEKTKYRDKCILILFVTYGLRISELYQLDMDSFNFTRRTFKIYRKRGKEVDMPINKTVYKAVHDYLSLERPEVDEKALFLSLQGRRITTRAIRQMVKKYTSIALQTSRDKGYSPHKLRATAASTLIEYGFSIYEVKNLLDHDNVTTTQLYSAHKKNAKRDIIRQYEWSSKEQPDLLDFVDDDEVFGNDE